MKKQNYFAWGALKIRSSWIEGWMGICRPMLWHCNTQINTHVHMVDKCIHTISRKKKKWDKYVCTCHYAQSHISKVNNNWCVPTPLRLVTIIFSFFLFNFLFCYMFFFTLAMEASREDFQSFWASGMTLPFLFKFLIFTSIFIMDFIIF